MEQWPNLLDQPDEFGRQSKPMRFSLLRDRGQTCGHSNAGVVRTKLRLGVRISFVQKISASSEFRSIRADFFRTTSLSSPPFVELCPENHQETSMSLAG